MIFYMGAWCVLHFGISLLKFEHYPSSKASPMMVDEDQVDDGASCQQACAKVHLLIEGQWVPAA